MRPPGWPHAVCDPDDADFPTSAERWLWDVSSVPRAPGAVWSGQPRALAFRVEADLQARLEGVRSAYARARRDLAGVSIDVAAVLTSLEAEAAVLTRLQREAALVAQALAGRRWLPRL